MCSSIGSTSLHRTGVISASYTPVLNTKIYFFSLWNDTFVPFCSRVNFSKLFFFPVFLFSPSFPNSFPEFGQFWLHRAGREEQVRTHFFWAGAAAMLEVLITNGRVAVENSQPFPLGNQCSSTEIPCSGKGRVSHLCLSLACSMQECRAGCAAAVA